MGLYTKTLKVSNYDELRDKMAHSGVFDMQDCAVEIWCPEKSETTEIERMTNLIESMVHVIDVKVGSGIENLAEDYYTVIFTDSPPKNKSFTRER